MEVGCAMPLVQNHIRKISFVAVARQDKREIGINMVFTIMNDPQTLG